RGAAGRPPEPPVGDPSPQGARLAAGLDRRQARGRPCRVMTPGGPTATPVPQRAARPRVPMAARGWVSARGAEFGPEVRIRDSRAPPPAGPPLPLVASPRGRLPL